MKCNFLRTREDGGGVGDTISTDPLNLAGYLAQNQPEI